MTEQEFDFLQKLDNKVDSIVDHIQGLPCSVNTYKISLIQKIVYGAISIILVAYMIALMPSYFVEKSAEEKIVYMIKKKPEVPTTHIIEE